jgi:hypothetical protein
MGEVPVKEATMLPPAMQRTRIATAQPAAAAGFGAVDVGRHRPKTTVIADPAPIRRASSVMPALEQPQEPKMNPMRIATSDSMLPPLDLAAPSRDAPQSSAVPLDHCSDPRFRGNAVPADASSDIRTARPDARLYKFLVGGDGPRRGAVTEAM